MALKRVSWGYVILLIVVLVASVSYYVYTEQFNYFISLFFNPTELRSFVKSYEPYSFLVLFGLQVSQVILAPVPGQVVATAFGSVYGIFWGTILGMIGNVVATILVIFISKKFGRPVIDKMTGDESVNKYQKLINKADVYPFMILVILPVIPDDVVCYAAGLTSIDKWRLIVGISIARIPAMVVLSVFGDSLVNANWTLLAIFGIPTFSLILFVLWKRGEIIEYLSD